MTRTCLPPRHRAGVGARHHPGAFGCDHQPGTWDPEGAAFARQRRFTDASDQNTTEYGGCELGDEIDGSVLAQRRFEARTDIETPDISPVSLYDQWLGTFSHIHTYNRLQLNYTVLAQQFDYLDASQRYRDRAFYEGEMTATYQLPNTVSILSTVFHSEDDYRFDNPAVAGGETTGVRTGAHVSIAEIAEFELTGGYFRREFAEHLGEISGLTVTGSVILYPTRLTTLRADVSRQDQPTRIPGAYGKVRTDSLLEVGHSYSPRLNLYARARVVADDFTTLHRTDMTYLGEIGAFYEISRGMVLGFEYDVSERSSAVPTANFLQHLVERVARGTVGCMDTASPFSLQTLPGHQTPLAPGADRHRADVAGRYRGIAAAKKYTPTAIVLIAPAGADTLGPQNANQGIATDPFFVHSETDIASGDGAARSSSSSGCGPTRISSCSSTSARVAQATALNRRPPAGNSSRSRLLKYYQNDLPSRTTAAATRWRSPLPHPIREWPQIANAHAEAYLQEHRRATSLTAQGARMVAA